MTVSGFTSAAELAAEAVGKAQAYRRLYRHYVGSHGPRAAALLALHDLKLPPPDTGSDEGDPDVDGGGVMPALPDTGDLPET